MQESSVCIDEKWPVIIHSSLQTTELFSQLKDIHRVRVSENIIENSVIFPKSAVAFLIFDIRDIESQNDQSGALDGKMVERFFTFSLTYYPAHNFKECVSFMLNIAKVTSKPTSTLLKTRLGNLASSSSSEEVVLNILSAIGLNCHDCFVLHQGCQSLSNVARASIEQLMDCSLDQETARKVYNFFHNNELPI
ncbi:uncharacterized protein C1orf146-like [Dendronephthya gigantea]|uniref:uncharacterized protein C1orf146-like n=1 Tax=Dendronephthya gigantea TaxID=151771 RepID=UPI00106BA540|nr:uncharacterized protein C1orf146-like [Dendronephthya gigantea]